MSKRFVSIGECMVEMAPSAEAGQYAMGFAGDTFNTAWYARRLLPEEWSVDYVTAVGTDAVSRRLLEFTLDAGIGTQYIQQLDQLTVGLYLIELEGAERQFSYWRGQSAARRLADDPTALKSALTDADVIYFSGITLGILTLAARETLLQAIATQRSQGARVVFDPNLRPRLWPSTKDMCEAIMTAAAVADIVLPSFEDEVVHFDDADPSATASRYMGQGAGMVVVKNGSGTILTNVQGRSDRHTPVTVANPVDTTAAGDSFNAGFVSAYLSGASMDQAVLAGSALAAKVICCRGALVPVT